MRREIDIYDPIEEKIPQKKQMNPKTKKILIYALCVVIGLALAGGILLVYELAFTGASTPAEAVKEYEKAALLYDVDGMIEYSSDYNKTVLYGNQKTSDRLLEAYLNKAYEGKIAQYAESEIGFRLVSSLEYEKGSKKYNEVIDKYSQKVETAEEDIDAVAYVEMTVIKGSSESTREYIAVKCGGRWYFAYDNI